MFLTKHSKMYSVFIPCQFIAFCYSCSLSQLCTLAFTLSFEVSKQNSILFFVSFICLERGTCDVQASY